MSRKAVSYLIVSLLLFSLSVSFVSAVHPGTCLNPPGSSNPNQCGALGHASTGYCYCDSYCTNAGDCCTDYDSVCQGGSSGGGTGGGSGGNSSGGGTGSTTCPPPASECNSEQATCLRTCGSPAVTYYCGAINNSWQWRTGEQFAAGCISADQKCSLFTFPQSCNALKGGNPPTNFGTCFAISGGPNHLNSAWRYISEEVCADGTVYQKGSGGCAGAGKSQIYCATPLCGTQGQTCCSNNQCSSGLTCQQGTCFIPGPPTGNPSITAVKVVPNPAYNGIGINISCETNLPSIPSGCGIYPKGANGCAYKGFQYSDSKGTATFSCTAPSSGSFAIIECYSNCAYLGSKNITLGLGQVPQPPKLESIFNYAQDYGLYVYLRWPNSNGDNFSIYRNKDDGSFLILANTLNKFYNDTEENDTSKLYGTSKYGYYVTAFNQYGESMPSNVVYAGPFFVQSLSQSACTDSDGGKNEFIAGKTSIGNDVHYDSCNFDISLLNSSVVHSVVEYYCSYDSQLNQEFIKKDLIQCKNECKYGACIGEANQITYQSVLNKISGTEFQSVFHLGGKDYNIKIDTNNLLMTITYNNENTNPPSQPPQQPSQPPQQPSSSLSSCAGRCGNYNSQAHCQCDSYCVTAHDCCCDKQEKGCGAVSAPCI